RRGAPTRGGSAVATIRSYRAAPRDGKAGQERDMSRLGTRALALCEAQACVGSYRLRSDDGSRAKTGFGRDKTAARFDALEIPTSPRKPRRVCVLPPPGHPGEGWPDDEHSWQYRFQGPGRSIGPAPQLSL